MGSIPPKKRRTKRAQGARRSHLVAKLAKRVNARSPVKVYLRSAPKSRPKETLAKARK